MNSINDPDATLQHILHTDVAGAANADNKQPVTSSRIHDKLQDKLSVYSENNPEPPAMKD